MTQYPINYDTKAAEALREHYGEKYPFMSSCEVQQIESKQAWIIRDKFGNKYLQSYNTIVSIYFADTREVLHLGKWSVTTSRHQSEFQKLV
jgi:hypothetical protein